MQTMLPPALEALMRMEGRAGMIPTEQDAGMIGMPTGMPMSNQAPYMQRRAPMDGSLGMLSALISGLSGHAGPMQEQPNPTTLVMRSFMSPNGGDPFAHGAMLAPTGNEDYAVGALQREFGGQMGTSMDARIAQANASKTGQGMGIVDPERNAAWKQGMEQDEAARRGLVNQRAMQVAQARTNRQSGMDPRTAALLAAMGGDSEMGQMMVADQVLRPNGAGLEMRQQNQTNAIREKAIEAEAGKSGVAPATDPAKQGETAVAEAIRGGDQAAVATALESEARALVAEGRKKGWGFKDVTDNALLQLQKKHGATAQQAQAAVEAATGSGAGAFSNRKGKAPETTLFGKTNDEIGAAIGQPFVDFWRHFISGE